MAPKDYVKRPQAKRKNTRKSTSGGARASSGSWLKIAISLAIVGLFVFGLYRLNSIDADNTVENLDERLENEVGVSPDVNAATKFDNADSLEQVEDDALAPLPVLGEEEWDYIDSLPDYIVEVDATGPLESNKEYIMQCGSFRTQDRAEELRATIAFQGLESRMLTSNGRNGLWYRVVLGPYDRKRDAERHRHQLRTGNVNGCKIW
jgi:hypothetical protein